jgi:hypothetical protein
MVVDGFRQEALGRLLVALRREQKMDGLVGCVDRTIEIAPLASDLDRRFIHPPADPHRTLPVAEGLFQLGTALQHAAVERRAVDRHPVLSHLLFPLAIAQVVGHVPTHTCEDNVSHKVGPLKLTIIVFPLVTLAHRGESHST